MSPVVIETSKCVVMTIERISMAKEAQKTLPAGGVREVCTIVSLSIFIINFFKRPVTLHKHTCVAIGTR